MSVKEQAIEYLQRQYGYTEDRIIELVDDEITSGNWLNPDWEEDYSDEFEAYTEVGNGEAEDEVRGTIEKELLAHLGMKHNDEYVKVVGENIWETITNLYPKLDT